LTLSAGVYFAGLLLKTQAMAPDGSIGIMLVIMLVAVIFALALAITEFRIGLKHLKKVLHNFDVLYPGRIHPEEGLDCVASFPGKYTQGWAKVVRLGGKTKPSSERYTAAKSTQLSVACVFFTPRKCTSCEGSSCCIPYIDVHFCLPHLFFYALPKPSTDTTKFGMHGINPDTGKCWCHDLYGESKCWGCQVSRIG
jgi:hypothetical protein